MAESEMETVGFIDIGTNSIHLLVSRFYGGSGVSQVFQDKESVRLGRSLYENNAIDEGTISKASLVVSRFAETARVHGATKIVAYATCAAREAPNAHELIERCEGVDVHIIPGTEEARLTALGVFGPSGPSERSIDIDIGGGSTEIAIRENGKDLYLDSLSIGTIRYAFGKGVDCSKPISLSDYKYLQRCVDLDSYRTSGAVKSIGFKTAWGSSGTLETIGVVCGSRRDDHDTSYFYRFELTQLMSELIGMDASRRTAYPGINKSRSDIIVSGGAIAEELMLSFGIERMNISHNGLREGMQIDHMLSAGYTCFNARDSSVKALAIRCGFDSAHAEYVRDISLRLFDETKRYNLHNMGADLRNLLSNASLLHDIGELVNYSNHHVLSQVMIENSDMVGFDCDELHMMGLMVRFHHKKFPGSKDPLLKGLDAESNLSVRMCAMFLRISDIMDRHRSSVVSDMETGYDSSGFHIILLTSGDAEMEQWRLCRLNSDFNKLFGCPLNVSIRITASEHVDG